MEKVKIPVENLREAKISIEYAPEKRGYIVQEVSSFNDEKYYQYITILNTKGFESEILKLVDKIRGNN